MVFPTTTIYFSVNFLCFSKNFLFSQCAQKHTCLYISSKKCFFFSNFLCRFFLKFYNFFFYRNNINEFPSWNFLILTLAKFAVEIIFTCKLIKKKDWVGRVLFFISFFFPRKLRVLSWLSISENRNRTKFFSGFTDWQNFRNFWDTLYTNYDYTTIGFGCIYFNNDI